MFCLEGVSKRFGTLQAVADVSLKVEAGEVLGFLGANGAGKSTTMRMLAGFLRPDAGRITVGGHDMAEEPLAAKRLVGYLPENAPVYSDLRVGDFLRYCGGLRGLRGRELAEKVTKAMALTGLEAVQKQRIGTLSKGFTHRTCLAQALLHDPAGLILDEPTDGLDPVQKREVQTLIRQMGASKAIIVSTHILEEVEAICTRVVIIAKGRVCLDKPIEAVRGHLYDYFEPQGGSR